MIRVMKQVFATAALVGGLLSCSSAATAAGTWSGQISDSACGAKHEAAAEGADKMPDRECTLACVKGGSKFVFVSDGNVYAITNQDFPDLAAYAGQAVKVDGDLKGGAIVIGRISKP
jgi:hypothetical protein